MPARRDDWEALVAQMPDVIRDALGVEPWSVQEGDVEGPAAELPLPQFDWLLELPIWGWRGVPFQVTPNQVRADPDRYAVHYARVMWSDLDDPILVADRNGRTVVLDGFHRLLKAVIEGRTSILAIRRRRTSP